MIALIAIRTNPVVDNAFS